MIRISSDIHGNERNTDHSEKLISIALVVNSAVKYDNTDESSGEITAIQLQTCCFWNETHWTLSLNEKRLLTNHLINDLSISCSQTLQTHDDASTHCTLHVKTIYIYIV